MLKNQMIILILAVVIFTIGLGNSLSFASTFKEDYDKAYELFSALSNEPQKAKLASVAVIFRELAKRNDAGKLKANALYWEGQCWFLSEDYLQALQVFERVLVNQNSNKEQDARFKVVQCHIHLKWMESAKWEVNRFEQDFPESKLIPLLKGELRRIEKK